MSFFSKKPPTEVSNFLKYAAQLSLLPEDLGREFEIHGEIYTIIGAGCPGMKFPIIARHSAGRTFRFSKEDVVARLYDPTART